MNEQELLALITSEFERKGFFVEKLAERDRPTADLAIRKGDDTYLIEVKQRDREDELQDALSSAQTGEVRFLESEVIERTNKYSRIIGDGVSQLRHTAEGSDFRLLWLQGSDEDSDTDAELFLASLTGIAYLITVNEETSEDFRCYFYELNDFYRNREILDGVFIGESGGFNLLINPLSPRYEALKGSALFSDFSESVIDPIADIESGQAIVVDDCVDRRNEQAVLVHLSEKYGRMFANFRTHRMYAVTPIVVR